MGVKFKEALPRKRVIVDVALLFRFGYITGTKKGMILTPVARCGGPVSGFTRTAAISEAVSGAGLCSTFLLVLFLEFIPLVSGCNAPTTSNQRHLLL